MRRLALLLAILLATPCSAAEITITVGPGGQYQTLAPAVAKANSDPDPSNSYVISLAPGTYLMSQPPDFPDQITRPMTIQSSSHSKRAVLKATMALPNQKGILLTVSSLTVNGLEMTGAAIDDSLGGNGAAIRDQNPDPTPATLVVQNSFFHDNQTAILQGNDSQETVIITNSQFKNNGNPNQNVFQHAVYIGVSASLMVGNSFFCGQLIGHEIKSRAAQTMVAGSKIYVAEGAPKNSGCQVNNGSFDIELANGGVGIIAGNLIVQGPSTQNKKMVSYGAEPPPPSYATNSLSVTNNNFVSTAGSIAIDDPPCVPVELGTQNKFVGTSEIVNPSGCVAP
jgi:hypothetical protein